MVASWHPTGATLAEGRVSPGGNTTVYRSPPPPTILVQFVWIFNNNIQLYLTAWSCIYFGQSRTDNLTPLSSFQYSCGFFRYLFFYHVLVQFLLIKKTQKTQLRLHAWACVYFGQPLTDNLTLMLSEGHCALPNNSEPVQA